MNRESESIDNLAILNIYTGPDTLNFAYDLHLNDSTICKVNKNFKKSIALKKKELSTLWAEIDKRAEIQINIEFGQIYYLKCDLLFEDAGKQPLIKLVDPTEASCYFNLF